MCNETNMKIRTKMCSEEEINDVLRQLDEVYDGEWEYIDIKHIGWQGVILVYGFWKDEVILH